MWLEKTFANHCCCFSLGQVSCVAIFISMAFSALIFESWTVSASYWKSKHPSFHTNTRSLGWKYHLKGMAGFVLHCNIHSEIASFPQSNATKATVTSSTIQFCSLTLASQSLVTILPTYFLAVCFAGNFLRILNQTFYSIHSGWVFWYWWPSKGR